MGGVIILLEYTDYFVCFTSEDNPKIIPVLFVTIGFGLIGFLDDYLKVVMKRSDGSVSKAEDGVTDYSNSNLCILSGESGRHFLDNAGSVFRWKVSGSWMACDSGTVLCSDRYSQWCELYGWT